MKTIIAGFLAVFILGLGVFAFLSGKETSVRAVSAGGSNVTVVDGKQIVNIKVKGGYQPQVSTLKAGLPTTLRLETSGTFDCTAAVRIPSLGINKSLPPSGTTDVDLGTLQPGTVQGTCGMGMYRFDLNVGAGS